MNCNRKVCCNEMLYSALARLGWKILTEPNNWWVSLIKAKYLNREDFRIVQKTAHSSYAWKSILQSRELLKEGIRWIVGNGTCINF